MERSWTPLELAEGDEPQFDAASALVDSLENLDAAYERAIGDGMLLTCAPNAGRPTRPTDV